MSDKLVRLYNTLKTVETKGNSTIVMADCIRYVEQLISEAQNSEAETLKKKVDNAKAEVEA